MNNCTIYKHHGIVWEFKPIWKYLKYAVWRKHGDFGAENQVHDSVCNSTSECRSWPPVLKNQHQQAIQTRRKVTGQQQHITMVKTVSRSNLHKLHLHKTCLKHISPQNQNNKYNLYENNFHKRQLKKILLPIMKIQWSNKNCIIF